ncbi:hypothetical protein BRADI_5g19136v3 [Brachypodium distachyon]|uniref:Uncharacterized protein n=1 Tax=Brachypodium distachyon TaxID=15368 RepID=A0A0Q3H7L0_BRADI|nr:hypothetical protein BRADI_5g19136v3 [Brachypodium distachyon]
MMAEAERRAEQHLPGKQTRVGARASSGAWRRSGVARGRACGASGRSRARGRARGAAGGGMRGCAGERRARERSSSARSVRASCGRRKQQRHERRGTAGRRRLKLGILAGEGAGTAEWGARKETTLEAELARHTGPTMGHIDTSEREVTLIRRTYSRPAGIPHSSRSRHSSAAQHKSIPRNVIEV